TLNLLRKEFVGTRLIMGGADPGDGSSEAVRRVVQKENLSDHLEITGFVRRSEIAHWFSRSDVYLNTTNVESFGIAVMEAAAAGLCIVTTNVGELGCLWRDGEDALLVPPNDAEAMAA